MNSRKMQRTTKSSEVYIRRVNKFTSTTTTATTNGTKQHSEGKYNKNNINLVVTGSISTFKAISLADTARLVDEK